MLHVLPLGQLQPKQHHLNLAVIQSYRYFEIFVNGHAINLYYIFILFD